MSEYEKSVMYTGKKNNSTDNNFGLMTYDSSVPTVNSNSINTKSYLDNNAIDTAAKNSNYTYGSGAKVGDSISNVFKSSGYSPSGDGLGNFATYNGLGISEAAYNSMKGTDEFKNLNLTGSGDSFFSQNGGFGLGLAGINTAMGIYSGLDEMKTAKLERKGMEQFYDYNQYQIDREKQFNDNIASAIKARSTESGLGQV